MFFNSSLVLQAFKKLRSSGAGKTGMERTSGLTYFLAFDALAKRESAEVLGFSPTSKKGKENRDRFAELCAEWLSVAQDREGIVSSVDDFGHVALGGKSVATKVSSNFFTVPLKGASEAKDAQRYPRRPSPLLMLGIQNEKEYWGVSKHGDWQKNLDAFLEGRKSTTPWTDMAVVLLRKRKISKGNNFKKAVQAGLHETFTKELADYWSGKIEAETVEEPSAWSEPSYNDKLKELAEAGAIVSGGRRGAPGGEFPLNTVLYGPPGTGKTYQTVRRSLAILHDDPQYGSSLNESVLMTEWREMLAKRRISFVTFHQSYSYEDFIEGIRPVTNDDEQIRYEVVDGVFKELAKFAQSEFSAKVGRSRTLGNGDYYKMSLGNARRVEDDEIYRYCVENNVLALGYGGPVDYSGAENAEAVRKQFLDSGGDSSDTFAPRAMHYFKNLLSKDDIVLVSSGNTGLRAIGKIKGKYAYSDSAEIRYPHFRDVEWLLTDADIPIESVSKKRFTQMAIYKLDKNDFDVDALQKLLTASSTEDKPKNYVLVIDEINRGNVSRVLGELITLLEADKRIGAERELRVTLPFSKESFGVPANLYVIGTMNTADRSIALVDVALRRRFAFEPIYPDLSLVEDQELRKIMEKLNENIASEIDDDHTIGHSYFMGKTLKDLPTLMNGQVLPLLHEYFFDQQESIRKMFVGTGLEEHLQPSKTGSRLHYVE